MKKIILFTALLLSFTNFSQEKKLKKDLRFPIWTTHIDNSDIIGMSFRFFPKYNTETNYSNIYGVHIDAFPLAPLFFFAIGMSPNLPLSKNEKEHQLRLKAEKYYTKIYGLNISAGSLDDIDVYGVSISAFGNYSRKVNGISVTGLINIIELVNGVNIGYLNISYKVNGLSIALHNSTNRIKGVQIGPSNEIRDKGKGLQTGIINEAKNIKGIQIGLFNSSSNLKGIQIGLWNKNQKRSLPIINWNFKS